MPMTVVEGWTADLDFVLAQAGQPANLTGATVELLLYDRGGQEITESGTLAVEGDPLLGVVRYSPAVGDLLLVNSPLYARVKVTSGGKDSFYPSSNADVWTVQPVSGQAP